MHRAPRSLIWHVLSKGLPATFKRDLTFSCPALRVNVRSVSLDQTLNAFAISMSTSCLFRPVGYLLILYVRFFVRHLDPAERRNFIIHNVQREREHAKGYICFVQKYRGFFYIIRVYTCARIHAYAVVPRLLSASVASVACLFAPARFRIALL